MMPLSLAQVGEENIIKRIGGSPEVKRHLENLGFVVGGEVTDYADMLTEARQIATGRMVKDAEALGADAVVGMRYASASVMQGAAEVIAYGTAVRFV